MQKHAKTFARTRCHLTRQSTWVQATLLPRKLAEGPALTYTTCCQWPKSLSSFMFSGHMQRVSRRALSHYWAGLYPCSFAWGLSCSSVAPGKLRETKLAWCSISQATVAWFCSETTLYFYDHQAILGHGATTWKRRRGPGLIVALQKVLQPDILDTCTVFRISHFC